jgi:hypothetical protein
VDVLLLVVVAAGVAEMGVATAIVIIAGRPLMNVMASFPDRGTLIGPKAAHRS